MIRSILQISLLLGLFCISCTKEGPVGNNPPVLIYEGLNANTLNQGLGKDSISINLSFLDVDGDIGGVNELNIFIIDNRDGSEYIVRSFPELPNNGKLLEGTMKLTLPSTCCIYPPEALTPACDKNPNYPENRFTVDVYIEDIARNRSNSITTDSIIMYCLRF
jgi:hypothetical protein